MTPRTIYNIIGLKPTRDGGSEVLIQIGRNSGVSNSWKASLVDKDENPIPGGELRIEFVANTTTRATSKLAFEKIPRDVQAEMRSP